MERQEDSGVLFPHPLSGTKAGKNDRPDYYGEIKIDLRNIDRLIEANGLLKVSAWRHKRKGKPIDFIKLKISWWKPGDLTQAQVRANMSADDEEWIVPE